MFSERVKMRFIKIHNIEIPCEHQLVTIESASLFMSISKRTLMKWINSNATPKPVTLKNKVIGFPYYSFRQWVNTIDVKH